MSMIASRARAVKPAAIGAESNPRDSWPAWTDADRWELGPDDDGPRPTSGPDFEPDDLDQAEWMGMSLRLAGEPMAEMITNSTASLLRFAIGQMLGLEGRLDREAAERAYRDELMADAFGEPGRDWHESERIAAVGCLLARAI